MRVLLVDDHQLLVEGLSNILEANGIAVAGVARDGIEALEQARKLAPDVILMDVRMPRCDGLTATRLIKAEMPQIKIVILTVSAEEQDLFEAVKSGANGYLLKNMAAESLIEALADAQHDIPPFAPGLASRLLAEFSQLQDDRDASGTRDPAAPPTSPPSQAPPAEGEPLTARQVEVLALVAEGLSYKEVAKRVSLSPRTVKYHMAEIMRKLHVDNRAQV